MSLKRFGILAIALFVSAGFTLPGFAHAQTGPPVANGKDATYYEGIWLINITETCHSHTDGRVVNLGTERLYMRVYDYDDTNSSYLGDLYSTLEDARSETNIVGIWDTYFDIPESGESYVFAGEGNKDIVHNDFVGYCAYAFEGWLKTAVKLSATQTLSKLTGANVAVCEPCDPTAVPPDPNCNSTYPHLTCSSEWNARWLEPLP